MIGNPVIVRLLFYRLHYISTSYSIGNETKRVFTLTRGDRYSKGSATKLYFIVVGNMKDTNTRRNIKVPVWTSYTFQAYV